MQIFFTKKQVEKLFKNEEFVKIMNEQFVNIKADREEKPEIHRLH